MNRLTLRYMRLGDIRQVATIDLMCFDPPWSPDSYVFEIRQSTVSHMVVLEAAISASGILGYGGLWKIEDEAHVSTIAIDPALRGNGYGEILLAGMVAKALQLKARYIVLEVRVSNAIAQSLYRKYGFSPVRRRKNYYHSDNEDAWDMRLSLNRDTQVRFAQLRQRLRLQHRFLDAYSRKAHPRG